MYSENSKAVYCLHCWALFSSISCSYKNNNNRKRTAQNLKGKAVSAEKYLLKHSINIQFHISSHSRTICLSRLSILWIEVTAAVKTHWPNDRITVNKHLREALALSSAFEARNQFPFSSWVAYSFILLLCRVMKFTIPIKSPRKMEAISVPYLETTWMVGNPTGSREIFTLSNDYPFQSYFDKDASSQVESLWNSKWYRSKSW